MRLSDAGLRRPKTKALDLNHRFPPTLNEDAARDRSNRLLESESCRQQKLPRAFPLEG
jgi:hypothetical protein